MVAVKKPCGCSETANSPTLPEFQSTRRSLLRRSFTFAAAAATLGTTVLKPSVAWGYVPCTDENLIIDAIWCCECCPEDAGDLWEEFHFEDAHDHEYCEGPYFALACGCCCVP